MDAQLLSSKVCKSTAKSPEPLWRSRAQPQLQQSDVSMLVCLKIHMLSCKNLSKHLRDWLESCGFMPSLLHSFSGCLCVLIWSFCSGVFFFSVKIIDLLFTITYTCNIVFPPSKRSAIGEVSAFWNKMLASINGRNRSFCKSISFICGLNCEGQELAASRDKRQKQSVCSFYTEAYSSASTA